MAGFLVFATLTSIADAQARIESQFRIARLKYAGGGDWYNDPSAEVNLLKFARQQTGLDADPRYEFHHLGARGDAALPATFQPVAAGAANPLAMRDALQAAEIDAVLIWPLCRETFSFVAYEAVAAGCAVVTGPDSGNVAAFVAETGHGRVLDEAALTAAFESGAILDLDLGRARRAPMLYDLDYSALTLDLARRTPDYAAAAFVWARGTGQPAPSTAAFLISYAIFILLSLDQQVKDSSAISMGIFSSDFIASHRAFIVQRTSTAKNFAEAIFPA